MVLLSESSTEATGSNKLNLTDNELNTPMKQKNGSNYPCDGIRRALAGIYRSERGPLPINQQGGGTTSVLAAHDAAHRPVAGVTRLNESHFFPIPPC